MGSVQTSSMLNASASVGMRKRTFFPQSRTASPQGYATSRTFSDRLVKRNVPLAVALDEVAANETKLLELHWTVFAIVYVAIARD